MLKEQINRDIRTTLSNTSLLVNNTQRKLDLDHCFFSCYKNNYGIFSVDFSFTLTSATGEVQTASTKAVLRNSR